MENLSLEEKVKAVIQQIRPFLQQDGGDIQYIGITEDHIVEVKLQGACGSCPHAKITLKSGVEATIKKHIPEIKGVMDVALGF